MLRYQVEGMSCGHCIQTITRAVRSVDAAAAVTVDLAAGQVNVGNSDKAEFIAAAIEGAGYKVRAAS